MSEFTREERFIVIKRKHLSAESRTYDSLEQELRVWLDKHLVPTSECVVVESDWPEYETVWAMIEARADGKLNPYQVLEQQIKALRQHMNDYMEAAEGTRRALNSELEKKGLLLSEMHEALSVADDRVEAAKAEAKALREEVARSEQHRNDQADLIVSLRTEVAALRARVVIVPERIPAVHERGIDDPGFNACLDELARLNGKVVSEGLLRRASESILRLAEKSEPVFSLKGLRESGNADVKLADELSELLGEGKEHE